MYNRESDSQYEIVLGQQAFKLPYDERLTDASLILARMQRGQLSAFNDARKMFSWLNEKMTYKQIYNALYGYVRWGWSPKRKVEVTDDDYASAEEWRAFFNRNLDSESRGVTPHQVS